MNLPEGLEDETEGEFLLEISGLFLHSFFRKFLRVFKTDECKAEAIMRAQPAIVSGDKAIPSTAISKNTPLTGSIRARRLPV